MSDITQWLAGSSTPWMDKVAVAIDEIQRLQKVVDAVRKECRKRLDNPVRHFEVDGDSYYYEGAVDMAQQILRTLDGEP